MLTRMCAGGVVFQGDNVLIMKNDKSEWVLPKGVIRNKKLAIEVALERVKHECGITAQIVSPAGETSYEFFSYSRKMPICNKIDWFIMEADEETVVTVNTSEDLTEGGFYPIDKAIDMITYSQDKSLVRLAHRKYNYFRNEVDLQATVS